MRRTVPLGVASAILAVAIGAATGKTLEPYPGVIGSDDRVPLTKPEAFWHAVGKIDLTGFSWFGNCTGILVAPDRVITAAHCIVDPRMRKRIAAHRVHFAAGLARDKAAARAVARCVAFLGDGAPIFSKATPEETMRDAAVIVLEKPLDIAPIPLSEDRAAAGMVVTHAGYGRDRRYVLSIHRGCKILDDAGPLHLTDCDTNFGQSGGPVLIDENGERRLAGIMVSFSDQGNIMLGVEAWRELIKAPGCAPP